MSEQIISIVNDLKLEPHPEGGFYKEVYRSKGLVSKESLGADFSGDRNYCTSIYFLLTSDNFSAFHRIKQDEIWHHYDGASLYVHVIDVEGGYQKYTVGKHFDKGESPQLVVPAGSWFASSVKGESNYSLVGCTVAPGFDFDDFELANKQDLTSQFPDHGDVIERYTRV
ncbi:cupin domain-containing protein [Aquimarina sp. AU474]|uniref:cupin domain-containing protein n=1 Tax=Aquimarina sp. AU474 TaxID=2108529 RepID=UPI000D693F7B|nr:cupin domain-containing protein [Aquimarina sp. AU474]